MLNTTNQAEVFVISSTVTDHASVILRVCKSYQKRDQRTTLTRINYDAAVKHLESVDFSFINQDAEANTSATLFIDTISKTLDTSSSVHFKPSRKKLLKPWLPPGLLRCVRHRDRLHKKYLRNPLNNVIKISYKRYRNFCNTLLRKLKINYEKSLIQNSKTNKDKWNAVKTIIHQKKQNTVADNLIKNKCSNSNSIEDINKYFSNVGKHLADDITNTNTCSTNPLSHRPDIISNLNSIVLIPPDEQEIETLILNLNNDCAVGWDFIPAKFLKLARHIIVPPLTKLLELCISQGVFPQAFKKSLMTPVYNSGLKDDVKNYRPISVLSTLSKVLEKVLNSRLISFLEHNKILSNAQFGFRSGRNTEDAVGQLVDHVTCQLDAKKKCIGVFLDLAKAFDTVSIPMLVDKLERIGVRGMALKIFQEFLCDRTQRVKIRECVSSDVSITFGVPQGSILGPSLFLIYINDLCELAVPNGKIFTYADDTALVFHGENWDEVQKCAEAGLLSISHWLRANLLTLNLSKSTLLQFSFSNLKPINICVKLHACNASQDHASCSCLAISQSDTVKYLGIILDSKLTWRQHIELTTARIRKLIWVFKSLRHVADYELLRTVYYALVQSVIGYCIGVWGGACKTYLLRLERAQRSVLKVMTFRPFRFPTTTLYDKCQVLTVRQMYVLHTVIQQHLTTPCNKQVLRKRTIRDVCVSVKFNTAAARRQRIYLSSRLYNRINRTLNINYITTREAKFKIKSWLLTQDYKETESILK